MMYRQHASDIRIYTRVIQITQKNKMHKAFGAFRLQFSTLFLVKALLYAVTNYY